MSYSQTHSTERQSANAPSSSSSSRRIRGRSPIRGLPALTYRPTIPIQRPRHSNARSARSISDSIPSHATENTRNQTGQALTTFRHLREAAVSDSYFVNTTGDVNFHSGGAPSDHSNLVATTGTSQNAEYDIYYNELLVKKRGTPLWEPGPHMGFPIEYRRIGVSIGDVGILYRTGDFAFLFNIFLPADHKINKGRVPIGFSPLDKSKVDKNIKKCVVYDRGSCLASSSLRRTDSSDFAFQTTGNEGAVLVMPDGALSEDLRSYKLVEKYIALNAKCWYEYVESDNCGMQTENGDIRVVVGIDKVSSWGIATFENVNVEDPLRFEFKEVVRRELQGQTHKWDRIVAGRAGPPEEEMRGLLQEPNTSPLRNQCVFVRALNVSVAGKVRDELAAYEVRTSSFRDCHPELDRHGSSSRQRNENLQTSQIGLTVPHPSKLLNKYLLEKYPNAEIVITKDLDWISVITEDDATTPSFEDICARVLATHVIHEKEGVVTLTHQQITSEDASSMDEYVVGRLFLGRPADPPDTLDGGMENLKSRFKSLFHSGLSLVNLNPRSGFSSVDTPFMTQNSMPPPYDSIRLHHPIHNMASSPKLTGDAPGSASPTANQYLHAQSAYQPFNGDHHLPYPILKASSARRMNPASFECDICSQTFTRSENLAYHRDAHLGIKKYTTLCGKKFGTPHGAKRHQGICPACMASDSSKEPPSA